MDNRSWMSRLRACRALVPGLVLVHAVSPGEAQAEAPPHRPIRIGLDADMTVMQAGEVIRRGIILLIERAGTIDRDAVRTAMETLSLIHI